MNTLAYFNEVFITTIKCFIEQTSGCSTLGYIVLALPLQIRLEKLAREEQSSLLYTFVNYGHKKFYSKELRSADSSILFTRVFTSLFYSPTYQGSLIQGRVLAVTLDITKS
jgi:hypothetical protein